MKIQIDRLVLRGLDGLNPRVFAETLQAELARAMQTSQAQAAMQSSSTTPALKLGRLPMQPGAGGARTLATGVARSIASGITRGRAR
jgi:hypothetical protein